MNRLVSVGSAKRAECKVALALRVFSLGACLWLAAACAAAAPAATVVPPAATPAPTATSLPLPPTVAPTATPRPSPSPAPAAVRTAAPTAVLQTVDFQVSGILSVEDLNTLLLAVRALPGVSDAQGGVQDVLVTFDPSQVTRKQIVDVIVGRGYQVKE